jgi:signal transduction histidine kinase
LTNILSNSIKYSDRRKANRFIKVNATVSENNCAIAIEDNGLGIEEQYLDKIFDMYFRAHTSLKGTGLGLYIVKDTIERLGGSIKVESVPGKGTTFFIELPNFINTLVLSN